MTYSALGFLFTMVGMNFILLDAVYTFFRRRVGPPLEGAGVDLAKVEEVDGAEMVA